MTEQDDNNKAHPYKLWRRMDLYGEAAALTSLIGIYSTEDPTYRGLAMVGLCTGYLVHIVGRTGRCFLKKMDRLGELAINLTKELNNHR